MRKLGEGRTMPWSRSLATVLLGLTLSAGCGAPQLFEDGGAGQDADEAVSERVGDDAATREADAEAGSGSDESDPDAADSDSTADPEEGVVSSASVRATAAAAGSLPATLEARSTAAAARPTSRSAAAATARPTATARASSPRASATAAPASDPEAYIGRVAEGGELGGSYGLTGLRSGQHEGFTRLVWELEPRNGTDVAGPAFRAEEKAGGPGGARIELSLSDVYGYDFVGSMDLDTPESEVVSGMNLATTGDDAMLRFVVELSRPARFAVVLLEEPVRLVLDVYDD
jgi:hypothetical protein